MSAAERDEGPVDEGPVERTGVERSLEIRLGSLGGFELRPTRLFFWKGGRATDAERIVSFGRPPVGLDYTRHETTHEAGPVHVRTIGNPIMTVAIAGAIALRRIADRPEDDEQKRDADG